MRYIRAALTHIADVHYVPLDTSARLRKEIISLTPEWHRGLPPLAKNIETTIANLQPPFSNILFVRPITGALGDLNKLMLGRIAEDGIDRRAINSKFKASSCRSCASSSIYRLFVFL